MKRWPLVALSATVVACSAPSGGGCAGTCPPDPPSHRGGVHGHVRTTSGAPVSGATVVMRELGNNRLYSAPGPTNASGGYAVLVEADLPASGLPASDTVRGWVVATNAAARESVTVAVPLRPRGETLLSVVRDIVFP